MSDTGPWDSGQAHARLWKACHAEGVIAIGWDYLGNFTQYATKDDFAAAISKHRADGKKPVNSSHGCYQFAHEMKIGDYVFVKKENSRRRPRS